MYFKGNKEQELKLRFLAPVDQFLGSNSFSDYCDLISGFQGGKQLRNQDFKTIYNSSLTLNDAP